MYLTQEGFNTRLRTSFSGKDEAAWNCIDTVKMNGEYQGGYSITGDLSRKPNTTKNVY